MKKKMVVLKDIIIKAGTVLHRAPVKTERSSEDHFSCIIGLSDNTHGDFTYCIDCDKEVMDGYFAELKD